MIKVKNLRKNYGNFEAVKSISFEINDGEIIGFLGANGAGKSTTLKVMTGYLSPTAGNVFVDDFNIIDHFIEIQKNIGYLPELNPLYSDMMVYDYLKFIARMRGLENTDFIDSFERVISQCSIEGVIQKKISECSKGFKQRIGLASAIIHDPKILILDEPVSGLDPNQIVEIRELIKTLGKEKIVIMSSHILQEIEATVDRIIIINEGKIVADGAPGAIVSGSRGKCKLELDVQGATIKDFRQIEKNIKNINILDVKRTKGTLESIIQYDDLSDPRVDIFNYAKDNNWILVKMNPTSDNLEDVFRDLTSGDPASNE